MNLVLTARGRKFTIYVVNHSDDPDTPDCPAKDFIEGLVKESLKSMTRVIEEHQNNGPILNEERSREVGDGIYEFKNRQGARVLWFYLPGRRTVLTHGVGKLKQKAFQAEVRRAKQIKDQVEALKL